MSNFPIVTEDPVAPRGTGDKDENVGITRSFSVLAPTMFEALTRLFNAKGVQVGQVYVDALGQIPNPNLKCIDWDGDVVSPPVAGGDGLFRLTFTYDTRQSKSNSGGTQNPTPGGPPVWYWDVGVESVNKFFDHEGNPIINSRGQPARNGIPTIIPTLSLEVQRYVGSFSLSMMVAYAGACNSDSWHGLLPGQAICMGIKPNPVAPGLWLESSRFEMREDGYDSPVPDMDEEGNLLNGTGGLFGTSGVTGQPPNGIIKTIQTGGGVLFVWRTQPRRAFSNLGL